MCIDCSPHNTAKRNFLFFIEKLGLTRNINLWEVQSFSSPAHVDANPTSFWNLWYPHKE